MRREESGHRRGGRDQVRERVDAAIEDVPASGGQAHRRHGHERVGGLAEELAGVVLALVVVAHHPDDLGPDVGSRRLDDLAELHVGLRLGAVGQVAGEHDGLGRMLQAGETSHRVAEVLVGVDGAVETTLRQQVRARVADARAADAETRLRRSP